MLLAISSVKEDMPYRKNKPARRELNSGLFNHVIIDPHPCSKKS